MTSGPCDTSLTGQPNLSGSFRAVADLPLLTPDLEGTGGVIGGPDDFTVEEIPAYLPGGDGPHVFALVEKRLLTTAQAISRICEALNLDARQAGYAGLKDKHGITRQWMSFEGADPQRLSAVDVPDVWIREVGRHGNKLRTGHLWGNRFTVVLRDVTSDAPARAQAVFCRLGQLGLPNYYGSQRFGARGDNADFGLRVLRGQARRPRDKRLFRLVVSALQSQLFNEALALRIEQGRLVRLLDGDVLQRRDSGACFTSTDGCADQSRLDQGELAITGPICGPRMMRPRDGSEARQWEDAVLARFDLPPESFAPLQRVARGGRRPFTVSLHGPEVGVTPDGALRLDFALPAGSYASVLLREVAKRAVIGNAVS